MTDYVRNLNLRTKVILTYGTFGLLFLILLVMGTYLRTSYVNKEVKRELRTFQRDVRSMIRHEKNKLATGLLSLRGEGQIKRLFARRDREALLKAVSPLFRQLKEQQAITHFYFHNPGGTVFLRLHEPGKHSDRIRRPTLKRSMETGRLQTGLEAGPLGTFTVRVVKPMTWQSERIGYVEYGVDLDHVLEEWEDKHENATIRFLFRKQYLKRKERFRADSLTLRGETNNWVEYYPTDSRRLPDRRSSLLSALSGSSPGVGQINPGDQRTGSNQFFGTLPATDSDGDLAGVYMVTFEGSIVLDLITRLINLSGLVLVGFLGLAGLSVFFFQRHVVNPIRRLHASMRDVGAADFGSRVDISSGDEIGELADHFNQMMERLEDTAVSRDFLNKILDTAPMLVFVKDWEGRYELVNQAMADFYGMEVEELEGTLEADLLDDEEQARALREDDRDVMRTGEEKFVMEERVTSPASGEERWFQARKVPLETVGESDNPRILGISTDITELKQLRDEIERTKDKYQHYIEYSPHGIFITDKKGDYIEVNPAASAMTGYDEQELLTMNAVDTAPPEQAQKVESHFRELEETGHVVGELPLLTKDGERRFWRVEAVEIPGDRYLGFAWDVTERRESQRELERTLEELKQTRVTRDYLRRIFDGMPGGILLLNDDGEITMVNQGLCEMLDYEEDDLLGEGLHKILDAYGSESGGFEVEQLRDVITDGSQDTEELFVTRGGEVVPVLFSCRFLEPDYGGIEDIICMGIDITERREARRQLKDRERSIRTLTRISADSSLSLAEKFRELLDYGSNYIGLDFGYITQIRADEQIVVATGGDVPDDFEDDSPVAIENTYCQRVKDANQICVMSTEETPEIRDQSEYEQFGIEYYVGAPIRISDEFYGTVCFASSEPAKNVVEKEHENFLELLTEWVSHELERKEANREIERLSRVLDQAADAVFITDTEGVIEYVNESFEEVTGYREEDVIGVGSEILASGHHDEEYFEDLWDTIQSGDVFQGIMINKTKTGEIIYCDQTIRPVLDESGEVDYYVSSIKDVTELKETQQELEKALKERETLLKEVHHRVKNNMQVISSMLNMQMKEIDEEDTRAKFEESLSRVKSMGMVHNLLYQSDNLERIEFQTYSQKLVRHLRRTYSPADFDLTVKWDIDDISVDIDLAIPCGLILTELISNSLQHAFPNRDEGTIQVEFHREQSNYELSVSDNGVGMPDKFSLKDTESLGFDLVKALVRSNLQGDIEVRQGEAGGTEIIITFDEETSV